MKMKMGFNKIIKQQQQKSKILKLTKQKQKKKWWRDKKNCNLILNLGNS